MVSRTFSAEIDFTESARFTIPKNTTRLGASVKVAELFYEESTQSFLIGYDATTYDEIVLSLTQGSGGGVALSGTGGRLELEADSTVVRTTGTQSIGGAKTFTTKGLFTELGLPKGTSFPLTPADGDTFWRTDLLELYVYDGNTTAWVSSAGPLPGVTSVTSGNGLTGGGAGAITLHVGAGDGIAADANEVRVSLAADPGLEFDAGDLRVQLDSVSLPSTNVGSVAVITANGLGIGIDDSSITAAGGLLLLKAGGVTENHLSSGAKQSALELKRILATKVVPEIITTAGQSVIPVSYEVKNLALDPIPQIDTSAKGVFVGYSEELPLRLRKNLDRSPVKNGFDEIFGRLSVRGFFNEDNPIAGVTILAMGSDVPNSGDLDYDFTLQTLSWEGGDSVDIGSGAATDYYKIPGSSDDDFIYVKVVSASLPGSDITNTILPIKFYPETQPSNFTEGVILGMAPGAIAGGDLEFTAPNSLVWNGGSPVNVAAGGVFELTGVGGSPDLILIDVTLPLPGGNTTDTIVAGDYYELMLSTFSSSGEKPTEIESDVTLDFFFNEVTDLYEFEDNSVLLPSTFVDYGSGGAKGHVHVEAVAATSWSVTHNLGSQDLLVQVTDNGSPIESFVIPDGVEYTSDNTLTLHFLVAQAGKARFIPIP